jgi:hypothetical protein
MRKFLCFIGLHAIKADPHRVNGCWFGFCVHCGSRFEASYDPMYGETNWTPK